MRRRRDVNKILVAAGQSGGHILPAVAFCQEVLDKDKPVQMVFVTSRSRDMEKFLPASVKTHVWTANSSIPGMLKLFAKAASLLCQEKPDMIVGFGGFLTIPFVILGRMSGASVVIHEQNVTPGRANKFLGMWAQKIIISFAKTAKAFGVKNRKVFLAGYPLRKDLVPQDRRQSLAQLGLQDGYFTVLVVGGSQGSRRLNQAFVDALKMNPNSTRIQVIHLTGQEDAPRVEKAYREMKAQAKVFSFLSRMDYAYSCADLVIARCGAGSIQEILRFGLPAILVPYPHAAGHQLENAKILAETGAALLVEEKNLSPFILSGLLDIFLGDPMRRKTMSVLAASLAQGQQKRSLAEVIL